MAEDQQPEFLIQIGFTEGGAATPQSSAENFVQASKEQLNSIAHFIQETGGTFVEKISHLASKPSECSLEFGIAVGGEAGIPFVTKGTAEANFKVSVKWTAKD